MTRSTRGSGELAFVNTLPGLQKRTREKMMLVLQLMAQNRTVMKACEEAGVSHESYRRWRKEYPEFVEAADFRLSVNKRRRMDNTLDKKTAEAIEKGLVFDPDRELPPKPGLEEFRWKYFGRPTLPPHKAAIDAIEDPTNMRVLVFMPTGTGKDTLVGDAVAWLKCDDRGSNRVAWFMQNQPFARRRLRRLDQYLTDHRAYKVMPDETPGGQIPTADLIKDFGPFQWQKGMVYPNGDPVPRPIWNQDERVFLGNDALEADPDLWAIGIESDFNGARIRTCVLSDIFTQENQESATSRAKQLATVRGTLRNRMDSRGRVIGIGTMLPSIPNNWNTLAEEWVPEGTAVIDQNDDGTYIKYRNRVAIVRYPAILHQGTDDERSYWEDRFPYRTRITIPTGTFDDETDAEIIETYYPDQIEDVNELLAVLEKFKDTPGSEQVEGLVDLRGEPGSEQWKQFQATHQQQIVYSSSEIDFPDEVLDLCDDPTRSYGQALPDEKFVQGVDPAKVHGAGMVMWGASRDRQTITAVEIDAPSKLGIVGIKNQLVLAPLMQWMPLWLCYEINRHEATLDDGDVVRAVESRGVRLDRINTGFINRNSTIVGPASLAGYMRQGIVKFPTATAEDRRKTALLKLHFKAFERHSQEQGRRSKPGQPGHEPDDLAIAGWLGFPRALEILEGGFTRRLGLVQRKIPSAIQRRFGNRAVSTPNDTPDRQPAVSPEELITMAITDAIAEEALRA